MVKTLRVESYELLPLMAGAPMSCATHDDKAVTEAEEKTATREVHHQPIFSLSHGFRQRVGVAQALVHKPKLLILDEPTSGLDPVQIVEMRATIRALRGEHTVLLSSHILSEISQTCDRLLVIPYGAITDGAVCSNAVFRAIFSVEPARRPSGPSSAGLIAC